MNRKTFLAVLLVLGFSILCTHLGIAAEPKVIKIGVLGPLSGDFAFGGEYQLNGAQLKAEELNAEAGDIRIEIISEDDAGKPDQSLAGAKKLITRDKIHALLGAWQSTCTLAIVPITAREGVPQFTTSVAGPITAQGSKWIFRVNAPTATLNRQTIEYVVKKMGLKKVAIFNSNEEVGKSVAVTSQAVLKELGLNPATKEEWNRGDKDFTGQLGRIQASGAEAVIFATGFTDMSIIPRQVRQLGMKIQLIGGDTIPGNPKFVDLAGTDIDGLIFSTPFVPVEDDPRIGPFVSRFKKRFSRLPDSWAGQFYDAVGMIHAAVKASGVVDRKQICDYVHGLKKGAGYNGIPGELYFDEKGEPLGDLLICRITGGKWKVIQR
jgi:branched-chain amino acid transport system substrate-binding protein